jgi:hypothetical protein
MMDPNKKNQPELAEEESSQIVLIADDLPDEADDGEAKPAEKATSADATAEKPKPKGSKPAVLSRFTGGWGLAGINFMCLFLNLLTLGLARPFLLCMRQE